MAFKQPCFIRKNTPELRKKLEELGVNYDGFYGIENECIVTGYGPYNNTYHTLNHPPIGISYYTRKYGPVKFKCLDCKTNENLFLALAVLRDDSDYMQWFTDGKKWFQNKQNDTEVIRYGAGNPINFHKATVEEIIEHFKKK